MSDVVPAAAYPIALTSDRPATSSRFWAIPILGFLIKIPILIPHYVVLYVLFLVLGVAHLVIWIPVLFTGRYPGWAFDLSAAALRWTIRVSLYLYGITDAYPAFGMDAPGDLHIERPPTSSRFFAIPLIGAVVKYILLIPHFVILYVLGLVVGVCMLVIWIPVLFTGQYPAWAFQLVAGTTLWAARVYGYLLGVTDRYPPFSFALVA
jgi:hypothetical protein